MSLPFSALTEAPGTVAQAPAPRQVERLLTDSRWATGSKGVVFFGLRGPRHDGHDHVLHLYQRGVRMFVLHPDRTDLVDQLPEASVFLGDPLPTLHFLAAKKRQCFAGPVWAITGSNGKTIVKEWLAQSLSADMDLLASPKSFNSQVGVPLSLWPLADHHQAALLEAGISLPGEMDRLHQIIQPTGGIFTNLGAAHDEGFGGDRQAKANEKALLFQTSDWVIFPSAYEEIGKALSAYAPTAKQLSWGHKESDHWQVDLRPQGTTTALRIRQAGNLLLAAQLPFADPGHVENATHVALFLLQQGWPQQQIAAALGKLRGLPMRLAMKAGKEDSVLIDDSYNNDLAGLEAALRFQDQHAQGRPKVVILSQLQEQQVPTEQLERLLAEHRISHIVTVGDQWPDHGPLAPTAHSTEELLQKLSSLPLAGKVVLVKGGRSYGFERVVDQLQARVHETRLEVRLPHLVHNLNYFKSKLKPDTQLMVMVKAMAYGAGMVEVARSLALQGVDWLAVAYVDEGVQLRQAGIGLPIMVLNAEGRQADLLVQHRLSPSLYKASQLAAFAQASAPLQVHLAVDTGMHRQGFSPEEVDQVAAQLSQSQLRVVGVYSHLAAADEAQHDDFTRHQGRLLQDAAARVANHLGHRPLVHIANSAAISRHPHLQFDMVRLGIGLYGIGATAAEQAQLLPLASLKTHVSQVREFPASDTVGYGRSQTLHQPSRIATLALGYADGYPRSLSNGRGWVSWQGHKAPVVGRVCMDMCMVDATGLDMREGDEVEVFGASPTLVEVASAAGTIGYELLSAIGPRVKRLYLDE